MPCTEKYINMSDSLQHIWQKPIDIASLNTMENEFMPGLLGITFSDIGPDFLCATMPVDLRTKQPFGVLHGGASVVLAETLGSVAGYYCLEDVEEVCFGLSINSNHLRSVSSGIVEGKTTPYHIGRTTQVWHIEIKDDRDRLINVSRLTLAVVKKKR